MSTNLSKESLQKIHVLFTEKYTISLFKYLLRGGYENAYDLHQKVISDAYAKTYTNHELTTEEKEFIMFDRVFGKSRNDSMHNIFVNTIRSKIASYQIPDGEDIDDKDRIRIGNKYYYPEIEKGILTQHKAEVVSLLHNIIYKDSVLNLQNSYSQLFRNPTQFQTEFESVDEFISHMFVLALTEAVGEIEKTRRYQENADAWRAQASRTQDLSKHLKYTTNEFQDCEVAFQNARESVSYAMNMLCDEIISNDAGYVKKPSLVESFSPAIRRAYKLGILRKAYERAFTSANVYERAILLETFAGRDSQSADKKNAQIDRILKTSPESVASGELIAPHVLKIGFTYYNGGVFYDCMNCNEDYINSQISSFTASLTTKELIELSKVLTMYSHAAISWEYKNISAFKNAVNIMQITRAVNECTKARMNKNELNTTSNMGEDE